MSVKNWWQRRWRKPKQQKPVASPEAVSKVNLREFVYLDEVSLRSLLSSLKGDLRDGSSEEASDAFEVEASTAAEMSNPLVGKAGVSSRFQTSNSSSIQTSRKATVQSWFRDLHAIQGIRLIEKAFPKSAASSVDELMRTDKTSLLASSKDLVRGELVEFRVVLSADPVYHLGAATSELAGMADDFPEMFQAGGGAETIHQLAPVRKILDRLLAGLVPIRAEAIDYSVVDINGAEYVVHNDLIVELDLNAKPLQIVGVTELLAYWKDLRRVLFSDGEFTVLARIAVSGIQRTWTPVKLADLFREMVPDLIKEINAAGKVPFAPQPNVQNSAAIRLGEALSSYAVQALAIQGVHLEQTDEAELAGLIAGLGVRASSISGQRSAFATLQRWIDQRSAEPMTTEEQYGLRERAREDAGLSLFPALENSEGVHSAVESTDPDEEDERMLDVEVIAIYW